MRFLRLLFLALFLGNVGAVRADDFQPDPRSVQRSGAGYRYPQAGWIVLHIEGEPYERGVQHGKLLAPEIASYLRCFAAQLNNKAPAEGWKNTRTLINALFLRRFDKEYLEEMKGIADGAAAAGARFDGRAIDLTDIVGLNCWSEIESLDDALEATPTGLEGVRFRHDAAAAKPASRPMHCSAFAATGAATADGKIVFGHVTMTNLYASLQSNVWLDVKPAKGHRILMQAYPGAIQSGVDYYQNDVGLLLAETTIEQTRFDAKGLSLASRVRKAMQYADGIEAAVDYLQKDNNGLYTNEWLLADTKTNEIAMFEMGTTKSKLYRSSKGEWFGGTPGFYWGCNNAKDVGVRLDTLASVEGRPANIVWRPEDRDRKWVQLYVKSRGKIDAAFAKEAFTTAPICSASALDAKFTTTALAKDLKSWALFGPPRGRSWQPTDEEKQTYPEIRPLVSNPWTILHSKAPPEEPVAGPAVVDLPDKVPDDQPSTKLQPAKGPRGREVWRGTLFPKTDADVWLATAFADYEKVVGLEKSLTDSPVDRELVALQLFKHRTAYLAAARAGAETPLAKLQRRLDDDGWYRVASGKGVLLLHQLRRLAGDEAFEKAMDSFGRKHAGQPVTAAEFQAHFEDVIGEPLKGFFPWWLDETGLPELKLVEARTKKITESIAGKQVPDLWLVIVKLNGPANLPHLAVDVTVETETSEETKSVVLEGGKGVWWIKLKDKPRRVVVEKYGCFQSNGGAFAVHSFEHDMEETLIVYGTGDEVAANREAAQALQTAIRQQRSHADVTVLSDKAATDDEALKTHHLILIGRPDCNALVERFKGELPVTFGKRSFVVRHTAYAHAGSAVLAAATNPLNRKYALTVVAGLSAEATLQTATTMMKKDFPRAEVVVLPNGGAAKGVPIPARELTSTTFE